MVSKLLPGITNLPPAYAGMRIGLFGGSFNPPHEGHRLVALQALKRLKLDAVWFLVSPGNPLKNHNDLAPLPARVLRTRQMCQHPRIRATGFEAAHGFTYTFETLRFLKAAHPGVRFVWIMGADNLSQFHRWERWQEIARLMPMAVYVRPGSTRRAPVSPAATALARYRLDEADASILADCVPPAWVYLHGLTSPLSSTVLRNARRDETMSFEAKST
ncbi:MAG TPA: nicotinate-nucleotide adenylyltransferase [Devosiaceae bacterium]|nr:nicotinate-nucleotide adenylyltransferase [Devosiaceae bacterium]